MQVFIVTFIVYSEDLIESGDEMTKNKRRLLSRVLAPSKRARHYNQEVLPEIGELCLSDENLKH